MNHDFEEPMLSTAGIWIGSALLITGMAIIAGLFYIMEFLSIFSPFFKAVLKLTGWDVPQKPYPSGPYD